MLFIVADIACLVSPSYPTNKTIQAPGTNSWQPCTNNIYSKPGKVPDYSVSSKKSFKNLLKISKNILLDGTFQEILPIDTSIVL